jgi:tetratricopeptide (TPR) repeat protein
VARALSGIHRLGLSHRDIKPANIMVDEGGQPTVLDFGTARFGSAPDRTGDFMGTAAYMAPEQRLRMAHDHRVDLYALGVTLHEALTGVPAARWKVGRPRSSLALLGPEVPLPLAEIVDRMLSLDPAERPDADEVEALLQAVALGLPLSSAEWPSPPAWSGDPSRLLTGSAVVTGRAGTGRRRMVQEARWQWFRKGYRSVAGQCAQDRPFGAIRDILAELFIERDPAARRALAGAEAGLLHAVWPDLPVPVPQPEAWPPDPVAVGQALGRLLKRKAPIAVIFWDLDQADIGSAAIVGTLCQQAPEGVLVWATASRPVAGLRQLSPPLWSATIEREVLPGILPPGVWPVSEGATDGLAESPLQSCARAWRALAHWRGQRGPAEVLHPGLVPLAVLDEPFPRVVANQLSPDVQTLLHEGHLELRFTDADLDGEETTLHDEVTEVTEHTASGASARLAFADRGTRRLALAAAARRPDLHANAARAWSKAHREPDAALRVLHHGLRAGTADAAMFQAAIRLELDRGNPAEVDRWLQLRDLTCGADDDFVIAYARLFVDLDIRPGRVRDQDLRDLQSRAASAEQRGLAAHLLIIYDARHGRREHAIATGLRWATALAHTFPSIASAMLREVALARLGGGEFEEAVVECRQALVLAREAGLREERLQGTTSLVPTHHRLTQLEVNAGTTLSAGLVYCGRFREAAELCSDLATRCEQAGFARGQSAMLANLSIARLYLGEREDAAEAAARCRAIQPRHRDPMVLAVCTLNQARLAIEVGDLSSGRTLLDEATNAGQSLSLGRQLAEAWTLALEVAVQNADPEEADRAFTCYQEVGRASDLDHWPAVAARWLWLNGDLPAALAETTATRRGHAWHCVRAEQCRLLLVSGRYEEALVEANALLAAAEAGDMGEIATFARLVAGAAAGLPDEAYEPLVRETRKSRWVHLYLGALHLDAIRRQLRGETVTPLLRQLRARARDVGHRFYEALAREDGW